jgi:hypothetical protein
LQAIVSELTKGIPNTIDLLNRFTNTTMTPAMMEEFVHKAIEIRFNDGKVHSVNAIDILDPHTPRGRWQFTLEGVQQGTGAFGTGELCLQQRKPSQATEGHAVSRT